MKVMTLKEVAKVLRVHPSTLYRMIKRGTGPKHVRVGSDHRYLESAVQQWLETGGEGDGRV